MKAFHEGFDVDGFHRWDAFLWGYVVDVPTALSLDGQGIEAHFPALGFFIFKGQVTVLVNGPPDQAEFNASDVLIQGIVPAFFIVAYLRHTLLAFSIFHGFGFT